MIANALEMLRSELPETPRVGIVLGSGLGGFASELQDAITLSYEEIPGWPPSTAVGHAGMLFSGRLEGVPIVVLSGRAHYYEGYTPSEVVFGVRVLASLGVKYLILTNAAGGINLSYKQGGLVLISDHINLQGFNPLIGPNDASLGPRFPDMTYAYSRELRSKARNAAQELGFELPEGVYVALSGPSYETPAEIRFLRTIGADLVGMSTVPEVIVARHMGVEVLGISCVTNMAAGTTDEPLNHEEVLRTGQQVRGQLIALLKKIIPLLEP